MEAPRVLIVEDDLVARQLMTASLSGAGYSVDSVESGEAALARMGTTQYALLITDIMLQGLDGVALLQLARQADPQLEVIMVTGAASLDSAIAACNNGAARYLRKPVLPGELRESVAATLARRRDRIAQAGQLHQIASQLQRIAEGQSTYVTMPSPGTVVRVGPLEIDTQRHLATLGGAPLQLSPIQFNLLLYLGRRAEQVVTPQELAREVLRYECSFFQARDLLKVHIHKLRLKIEADPAAPKLLLSRRGVGYLLSAGEAG